MAALSSYTVSDGQLVLTLEPAEEGGFVVTSPDDPELVTQAGTLEEAFANARDAADALHESRNAVELPSPPRCASASPRLGCGAEWLDMLRTGEKLLLAGLRREVGPNGDLRVAYRRWYREQMDEHDRLVSSSYDRLHAAIAERGDAP
ncbi:MAG: type II toxin-antitoxin system HicB family antitoxin [Pirellulaceae bacterium]